MDRDVNLKVIDDNKVTIHGNSNQTISNQLKHQQNTKRAPQKTKTYDHFWYPRPTESETEPFQ